MIRAFTNYIQNDKCCCNISYFYFARKEGEMKQAFITQQLTTGLERLHIYTYTKEPYIPFPNIKKNLQLNLFLHTTYGYII